MKRFRISQTDLINANIWYKSQIIANLYDSGFNSIDSVKYQILNKLGWQHKGQGKRIEIAIHNLTKEQSKYINTFS